jgi:hypothetical protein
MRCGFSTLLVGTCLLWNPLGPTHAHLLSLETPSDRLARTEDLDRPGGEASKECPMMIRPGHPVQWTAKCDAETIRLLRSGKRRLNVSVHSYEPPTSGPAIFAVSCLSDDRKKSKVVDHFSIFPNSRFQETENKPTQQFQINLGDCVKTGRESQISLEVGFDPSKVKSTSGSAEVSFKFIDLK